ncbi:MAG: hypothetical protein SGI73_04745 [Chloroflexota bacterium]|nr:hypothetical protein [Chloroflexota bacterium]
MSYRQINARQWEWADGTKTRSVQLFDRTRRAIWSARTDTPDGAVFDDGIAQSYDRLLAGDPPPVAVPDGLLNEIHAAIKK